MGMANVSKRAEFVDQKTFFRATLVTDREREIFREHEIELNLVIGIAKYKGRSWMLVWLKNLNISRRTTARILMFLFDMEYDGLLAVLCK
jgi:hypothetical protein